jgi:hypothetical protein
MTVLQAVRQASKNITYFLIIVLISSSSGWAAPKTAAKMQSIPSKPSAPPQISKKVPTTPFLCERNYTHKGKTLVCDSFLGRDGENLRSVLSEVPDALQELETYQHNRKVVRNVAYVGTGGLLTALIGYVVSLQMKDASGNFTETGNTVRNITVIGGLGVMALGLIYGFTLNSSNEEHLTLAVQKYNAVKPQTPIELQFSTGFNF